MCKFENLKVFVFIVYQTVLFRWSKFLEISVVIAVYGLLPGGSLNSEPKTNESQDFFILESL